MAGKSKVIKPATIEFFRSRSLILESGCWEWTGSQYKGFGKIRRNNKLSASHRVAYEAANPNENIEGLEIFQTCGNKLCCNPEHLVAIEKGVSKKHSADDSEQSTDKTERKVFAVRVCRRCNQEFKSRGKSENCHDCTYGISLSRNPYVPARPHRCGDCGARIDTRVCVRCNTLDILRNKTCLVEN